MKLMVQLESLLNQKDDLSGSLQIKVRIFAHAVHTNNASVSTNSSMLLLDKIKYEYQHNGSVKTDEATVFFIKGVHGMVRHTAIKLLIKNGIEVCNTTARIKSKKDVSFLNEGTHPLGLCLDENHKNFKKKVDLSYFSSIKKQCIVNQVFGMIGPQHASLIKYHIPPILGNRVQETARMPITIQAKGISRMNNRHNKSMNTLIAQNFSQRYIGNEIVFWIDVSKLSTVQLGLMLLTCENIREFGGGINAGYGRVEPQEITLGSEKRWIRKNEN